MCNLRWTPVELNGLRDMLVDYGDIHLNILHSLLTWGIHDYKLFITIIASKQFFSFFSFFLSPPAPPFFFSRWRSVYKRHHSNWYLQLEFSDWMERTRLVLREFVESSNSNGRKGESVEIDCLNLCFLNREKHLRFKSWFLSQWQKILWDFILTDSSFHEYQGPNSIASV